jgi:hypothetical protein
MSLGFIDANFTGYSFKSDAISLYRRSDYDKLAGAAAVQLNRAGPCGMYSRFTGLFAVVGSVTLRWRMGVESANFQVSPSVWLVPPMRLANADTSMLMSFFRLSAAWRSGVGQAVFQN